MNSQQADSEYPHVWPTWNRRRSVPRGQCHGCLEASQALDKANEKALEERKREEKHFASRASGPIKMERKSSSGSIPLERKASRELRSSILYTICECCKRNGLQDDCRMCHCQGRPPCLVKPEPECAPGRYFRQRNEAFEREIERRSAMARNTVKRESQNYSGRSPDHYHRSSRSSGRLNRDRCFEVRERGGCYEVMELDCDNVNKLVSGAKRGKKDPLGRIAYPLGHLMAMEDIE